MNFGISGRTALVLGAGGGLGAAIAAALAQEGVKLALMDIAKDAVEGVTENLRSRGADVKAYVCDLAEISGPNCPLTRIMDDTGGPDILINNSGGPPPGVITGISRADWDKHFRAMVFSLIHLTDTVLPEMRSRKWGRIITSASSGVIAPIPNLGLSNSLRSTLVGWSKTLAREVAEDNITVNVIVPGRIATPRIQLLDEKKAQREQREVSAVRDESLASIPLKRYGRPEEYADVVAFLSSARASYITGSVLRVDGGYIQNV